jgi:hypothetical protein
MKAVSWSDVQSLCEVFAVWQNRSETTWFEKSWQFLSEARLNEYSNDAERHWVYIRAIALGMMYLKYCNLESRGGKLVSLFENELLSHVRIGSLAGPKFKLGISDDRQLFEAALIELARIVQASVYGAILTGFGGSVLLYAGLWGTSNPETDYNYLDILAADIFDLDGKQVQGSQDAFQFVFIHKMWF